MRATEVAPPAYYLLLHFWIRVLGSDSVWTMRLLSVLGGIALVAAVWWLGRLVAGNAVALLAALMTALSPLAVEYVQEVRAYTFVMLGGTIAVAAAVEATRRPRNARPWLVVSAAASVATIWLHYTGLLVILPLVAYVWTSRGLSIVARRAYVVVCAAAFVIVAPLMVIQLRAGHQGGVAPFAKPTATNFARVLGTPFDGRFPPRALTYLTGAVAVAVALVYILSRPGVLPRAHERWLVLAAAVIPVVAIAGVTVAAKLFDEQTYYVLITRYTAVSAPFLLVAIAITLVRAPRAAAIALAALVVASIVSGLSATYSSANFQPNLRAAFAAIARDYHAGDTVVLAGAVAQPGDADYYVAGLRSRWPHAVVVGMSQTKTSTPPSGLRLWVVSDTGSEPVVRAVLSQEGWHAISREAFSPDIELTLDTR